jgi:hypothetical protein
VEIAEYVRAVGRRSRIVVIAAAVAGVVAVMLFFLRPQTYRATATVVVPVPPGSTSVLTSVTQSVSDFQAAVGTDVVAERVAERTSLSVDEVAGGLDSSRISAGGLVEVRFVGTNPDTASQVVQIASQEALRLLLEARLAPAEKQLEIAQDNYDEASSVYRAFLTTVESVQPSDDFEAAAEQITSLREQIQAAIDDGNQDRANQLQRRLDDMTAKWSPLIVEWQALNAARSRAAATLDVAQANHTTAQAAVEVIEADGGGVDAGRAVPVSRLQVFFRTVVPTVVIATVLAIGLVILLEAFPRSSLRGWRARGTRQRTPSPEPVEAAPEREIVAREPAAQGIGEDALTPRPRPASWRAIASWRRSAW